MSVSRRSVGAFCSRSSASPLRPAQSGSDAIGALELPPHTVTVRVPTTVLWGEGDTALPPALLEGLDAWVPSLDLRRVAGATQWIVHEQPALIAETVLGLVGRA